MIRNPSESQPGKWFPDRNFDNVTFRRKFPILGVRGWRMLASHPKIGSLFTVALSRYLATHELDQRNWNKHQDK